MWPLYRALIIFHRDPRSLFIGQSSLTWPELIDTLKSDCFSVMHVVICALPGMGNRLDLVQ